MPVTLAGLISPPSVDGVKMEVKELNGISITRANKLITNCLIWTTKVRIIDVYISIARNVDL